MWNALSSEIVAKNTSTYPREGTEQLVTQTVIGVLHLVLTDLPIIDEKNHSLVQLLAPMDAVKLDRFRIGIGYRIDLEAGN